jgi:hypothetical protein
MEVAKLITDRAMEAKAAEAARAGENPFAESPKETPAVWLWIVGAAAAFNFLSPLIFSAADTNANLLLVPVSIGVLLGEIGALAGWLVWSNGPFLRRLAIHWAVAVGLAGCLAVGFIPVLPPFVPWDDLWGFAAVAALIPIHSLAGQLPHWVLRTHLGWRLERTGAAASTEMRRPLSILDLLSGTAVVAVCLGLVRAALAFLPHDESVWMPLAIGLLAVVAASLIVLLPVVVFSLRPKDAGSGLLLLAGYAFLLVIGILTLFGGISGGGPPGEAVIAIIGSFFAFTFTLAVPFIVWRSAGYRLVWAKGPPWKSEAIHGTGTRFGPG